MADAPCVSGCMAIDEWVILTFQEKAQEGLIWSNQWPREVILLCRFQFSGLRWNSASDCQRDPRHCQRSHHTGPVRRHAW